MLAEFEGNLVKVHRALADAGTSVRYSTLTAFCRNNHLLNSACDPRRSVVAARQWLLELVNGRHSVECLQSQLSPAADLQFLFSQLKHGRSRHRKKAATIIARERGISNSAIATALRSSRSTTRRYYKMYLEAGPEKLFAWNTTRHMGAEHQFSERTKRILEILHHKPINFRINRVGLLLQMPIQCAEAQTPTPAKLAASHAAAHKLRLTAELRLAYVAWALPTSFLDELDAARAP